MKTRIEKFSDPRISRHLTTLVCGILATSCATNLKRAAGTFAEATTSGLATFRPISTTAYDICTMRAESAFLKQRVSGEKPWGSPPKRSEYFADKSSGPVPEVTWQDYCGEIHKTVAGLTMIYSGLTSYANALKRLAGAANVNGKTLKAVGADAQTLAAKLLPANAPASTGAGEMLTAFQTAAPSIANLASIVEGIIAEEEIQKSIMASDAAIQILLTQLLNYSKAVRNEALALQSDTRVLLNWMDAKMGNPGPLEAVQYSVYAQQAEKTVRDEITLQDTYTNAVSALRSAHSAMRKAAESPSTEKEVLALVMARAQTVEDAVKDIQVIASAKWSGK